MKYEQAVIDKVV